MPSLDTSALAYQFKQSYGKLITDLFARHSMTYNLFDKSDRKAEIRPGGTGYYFSTRQGDVEGIGGRIQGAPLPEPMTGDGVQGTITPRLIYAVIRMDGLAIEAGKSDQFAFVNAQSDATMNAYNSLVNDLNRQCHSDGWGLLGTTSAACTPSTSTTWTAAFDNDTGTRYMKKGMVCDFYVSTALTTQAAAVRISSINPITSVVTFEKAVDAYQAYHPITAAQASAYDNAATSVAAGSFLVRYGARLATHATTGVSRELNGLEAAYDDGTNLLTYEGITVATDPEFKANIMGNSSVNRELSIDLMIAACNMTAARSNSTVELIRMGLGQQRKYFGLLAPDIRYAPQKLTGGYTTLSFAHNAAIDIVVDPVTQANKIYFEPKKCIKKYELTPIGWGGFDANKMHWRSGYDQADMFLRTYTNLGVEERQALTLLKDLTEPANAPW
jgi:hypothetical protein